MTYRRLARCLAVLPLLGLLAGAPAEAAEVSVKLELSIKVEVPKKNLSRSDLNVLNDLKRSVEEEVRGSGTARREIATLAQQRVQAHDQGLAEKDRLVGPSGGASAAEVEFSLSITIKTGKKLSRDEKTFLRDLEQQIGRNLARGKIRQDQVESQIAKAVGEYGQKVKAETGAAPTWGDKPNTTVMLKLTIKF